MSHLTFCLEKIEHVVRGLTCQSACYLVHTSPRLEVSPDEGPGTVLALGADARDIGRLGLVKLGEEGLTITTRNKGFDASSTIFGT